MTAKKKAVPTPPTKTVDAEINEAEVAQQAADAAQAIADQEAAEAAQAIADQEAAEAAQAIADQEAADKAAAVEPTGSRVAPGKAITAKGSKMLEAGDTITAAMLAGGEAAFNALVKNKCIIK